MDGPKPCLTTQRRRELAFLASIERNKVCKPRLSMQHTFQRKTTGKSEIGI